MNFRSFYRIFFLKKMTCELPQAIKRLCMACALGVATCQTANAQAPIENIEQLKLKVARFLTEEYEKSNPVKVDIKVGNLDNRLRLSRCDQNVGLILKDTTNSGGNVNVEVNCKGASSWTILVPALARVYRSVAVAGRNLQRGELIDEDDLATEVIDVSDFRMGFSLTSDTIIGKEVKYTVNKGETFRNSALDAPMVIKRGDTVSMEANIGGISVKTSGTAVSDGRVGQQIRVKNNQSSRVINAKVVGSGLVQSVLQ